MDDPIFNTGIGAGLNYPYNNIVYLSRCNNMNLKCDNENGNWEHKPIPCSFGGGMNTALSLVFSLGYKEVGLIGCDLGIKDPVGGVDFNHFHPEYLTVTDFSFEDGQRVPNVNDILRTVHRDAEEHFRKWDRTIVNCGIGGELEEHERMSLDGFIQG
jgi:hypothetical protein